MRYGYSYPEGIKKSTIPAGKKGRWAIDKFSITDGDCALFNMRTIRDGMIEMCVGPGDYTRLSYKEDNGWYTIFMSDTRFEALTNEIAIREARGKVRVHGLGMGFLLENILSKSDVKHVHVVELDKDLIKLVSPHFKDYIKAGRLKIEQGDVLEIKPSSDFYDFVWHDIWATIGDDMMDQKGTLRRRWAKHCARQEVWAEEFALRCRRRGLV